MIEILVKTISFVIKGIPLIGGLSGLVGAAVSIAVYRRDKARLKVTLEWDVSYTGGIPNAIPNYPTGVIRAYNVGRRPSTITLVAVSYYAPFLERIREKLTGQQPKNHFVELNKHFLSIGALTLHEGNPPGVFILRQVGFERHCSYWKRVRALVEDSSGRKHYSRRVKSKPSWAGGEAWKPQPTSLE